MSQAAIALGSNLGDSLIILKSALDILNQNSEIQVESYSSWYQTAPIGPPQPDYINACAILRTQLHPQNLLDALLQTELKFGRERTERWGARTLDLDLLLFDAVILATPTLEIPHPRLRERAFVLVPLAEIAPNWIDPVSGSAVATLAQAIDTSGVQRLKNRD